MSAQLPPLAEAQDRKATGEKLERLAASGSIRGKRRHGVMGWLRGRLGWRP